jgi:hypothetical protein
MKKIVAMFSLLPCIFLFACADIDSVKPFDQQQAAMLLQQHTNFKPAANYIKISLPNKNNWQRIDLSFDKKGSPVMLVPLQETTTTWTERIDTYITGYNENADVTAKQFSVNAIAKAHRICNNVSAQLLEQSTEYVIYRINSNYCSNHQATIQIAKAFNGSDAVYVVRYTALPSIGEKQITAMTAVIKNAQLIAR